MKVQNSQYLSALQFQERFSKPKSGTGQAVEGGLSFQEILTQKEAQTTSTDRALKFSKHAANRLADRNIRLTDEQMERLSDGTQRAGAKGIKESLVVIDQLAFIVNVPNHTVVTAMDQKETQENIFTNIDGAVFM